MASSKTLVIVPIYIPALRNTSYALPQMFGKILRRPAPGELGTLAVVHGHPLLVGKAVLGIVAVDVERFAGGLLGLLEGIDGGRRAPVVLAGEMRLQRNPDIGRFRRRFRRDAVEHHARGELGDPGGADDRHRAAE